MKLVSLNIDEIRIDGNTQSREEINKDIVNEYASVLEECTNGTSPFPPVVVFHDGTDYWLSDGFHRLLATKKAGSERINCDVRKGTVDEARLFGAGANVRHGLRRTNLDKRKAVFTTLEIRGELSDAEIARHTGVTRMFVYNLRKELEQHANNSNPEKDVEKQVDTDTPERKVDTHSNAVHEDRQSYTDAIGREIPDDLVSLYHNSEAKMIVAVLDDILKKILNAKKAGVSSGIYPLNYDAVTANIANAISELKECVAYAVCPMCQGKGAATKCEACQSKGLISEFRWNNLIPKDIKKMVLNEAKGRTGKGKQRDNGCTTTA